MDDKFDLIVIGFGKAGKTLAADFASRGKTVALIEQSDKMFGGTCINEGCIPSKFLIEEAKFIFESETFGKGNMYSSASLNKELLINDLRAKNYAKLNNFENVKIIVGHGEFVSEHSVLVKSENPETGEKSEQTLTGEYILINTGSTSIIPEIKGLEDGVQSYRGIYTSRELLNLSIRPEHLVIVGGGYIGMEFASMYRNFGSEVTVIIRDDKFLPREDQEIAETVKQSLERRGVKFMFNTDVLSIKTNYEQEIVNGNKVLNSEIELSTRIENSVEAQKSTIKADATLLAIGRKPATQDLGLEKIGIQLNARGGIITDEQRRTNIPHIYACGDVIGKEQFTYISLDDYRIVKSSIFENAKYTEKNRGAVPYSVFIDPPFSRVGLTEKEALEKGYSVKVCKLDALTIPKAKVLRQRFGLLKAIVDAKTNKILGAHLFCAESHEMINLIKLAIDSGITADVLRDMIFTHPTMSESLNDLFK